MLSWRCLVSLMKGNFLDVPHSTRFNTIFKELLITAEQLNSLSQLYLLDFAGLWSIAFCRAWGQLAGLVYVTSFG